ncbi:D-aminoacyl-tRNA deacylase 2 [Neosynchiropus ocellatus]
MAEGSAAPVVRLVLQQCLRAKLQVKPAEEEQEAQWVQVERGMLVYVCFLKGASEELVPKIVSSVLNLRLCESDSGALVSVLDLPGSVLVVPQATLGGKVKGKSVQYHNNIQKETGLRLYHAFVAQCEAELSRAAAPGSGVLVQHGTYGNRQVLELDTNGPFTHLLEF